MKRILFYLYNNLPKSFQYKLGKIKFLKGLRDFFLKSDGRYKEGTVKVNRTYQGIDVNFKFCAAIKTAAKAKKTGIETTVLNNSIQLIQKYKQGRTDCTILDVGANFGFLSLVWSQTIAKDQGRILAFEPSRHVFKSFSKSIETNRLEDKITIINKAVGLENKPIKLYIDNATSNINAQNSQQTYETVDMVSLDAYFSKHTIDTCDLIKIDVDGIEYEILKGSQSLINQFRPLCIIETNDDQNIIDFFKNSDYQIFDMQLQPLSTNDIPLNIFCVPNELS
ncbi:FkbM family methyltransferase [uncultured Psychroserpens sp.]|uniref:FkbM family methyltransferase n=1 Tax=uncultured Psychroserpens sp. TaxID=255436 RepID=UPI002605AF3C|nr:FkbM family methyltransferase [uncultured Psychroserpens sp.]